MKRYAQAAILLLSLTVAGCAGQNSADEHAHEHEDNLLLTTYSDKFELFVDARPFAVGVQSPIIVHFTRLDNFRPLEDGSVRASLIVGADGIRQTLDHPTEPGIYRFSLKPEMAGAGRLVFELTTVEGVFSFTLSDIVVYDDEHAALHAASELAISKENSISFSKEQGWKTDFATAEVKREPFDPVIKTAARILPSQIDERMVSANAGGTIAFVSSNMTEGMEVKAGQVLFSIESGNLIDNNLALRYREALTEYERAVAEYERKSELSKDGIVSESDLQKARADFLNAKAVSENLSKASPSGQLSVVSPIAGFVRQILVRNGEYIEAGQPVAIVSASADLLIKADLQSKYFPLLAGIKSANIKTSGDNRIYTLEELEGKFVSCGKFVSDDSPLIPVVFRVRNSAGLLPGSFVEMYIKIRSADQAISLPVAAISEEMGSYFVFVQLTPELFEKRSVKTGFTDGLRIEIIEGLEIGERVVRKGAVHVKLAQGAGALDAHSGHAH